MATITLPLKWQTPLAWAEAVLTQPLALLNDHAHLEKKAAANALELLNRWPEPTCPDEWVKVMTSIARDEVEHLGLVLRLLAERGGKMSKMHRNPYANQLRSLVRIGKGPKELVDRLLISALIEVRSCERFQLLSEVCQDASLAKLYRGLYSSEAGHYLQFTSLAETLTNAGDVTHRWEQLLTIESDIISSLPSGSGMHSGV